MKHKKIKHNFFKSVSPVLICRTKENVPTMFWVVSFVALAHAQADATQHITYGGKTQSLYNAN